MQPDFLTFDEILAIHRDQILRYGGSPRVRDLDLLQSALALPSSTFDGSYLHDGIPSMAAAYLFHIIRNHPFVDGNKRVGLVAALVFLRLNGHDLATTDDEIEALVVRVAKSEIGKDAVVDFFRSHTIEIV